MKLSWYEGGILQNAVREENTVVLLIAGLWDSHISVPHFPYFSKGKDILDQWFSKSFFPSKSLFLTKSYILIPILRLLKVKLVWWNWGLKTGSPRMQPAIESCKTPRNDFSQTVSNSTIFKADWNSVLFSWFKIR